MSAAGNLLTLALSSHWRRGNKLGVHGTPHPHSFAAFSWVTAISGRQPR
jgi:hypothetical protein